MSYQPQPAQRVATDTPAVIALVLGIVGVLTFGVTSAAGIVVGHATRANTPSRGLSTAALVVSYVVTGFFVLVLLVLVLSWMGVFVALGI